MSLINLAILSFFLIMLYLNFNPEYDPYYTYCDNNMESMKTDCTIEMQTYNITQLKDSQYVNETVTVYDVYLNNNAVKYNLYDSRNHYFRREYKLGNSTCYWDGKDYPKLEKDCSTILKLFIDIMIACFLTIAAIGFFEVVGA